MERLLLALEKENALPPKPGMDVFVAYTGEADCPVDCRMTFDVEGALEAE